MGYLAAVKPVLKNQIKCPTGERIHGAVRWKTWSCATSGARGRLVPVGSGNFGVEANHRAQAEIVDHGAAPVSQIIRTATLREIQKLSREDAI
jgi:hypothetical protein